jgi:hypothetical protein
MKKIDSFSQKFNVDLQANKINKFDQQWYQIATPEGFKDLKSVTTILSMAHPIDAGLIQWMKREGRNADIIRDEAAQLGTHVHKLIEMTLTGAELTFELEDKQRICTLEEWETFLHWCDWYQEAKKTLGLKPLFVEQIVFNIEEGIAGTVDLIAETNSGIIIIDWKTGQIGNGEIQVSKYLDIANNLKVYGEIKGAAILQLGNGLNKKGYRLSQIDNIDYHIKTFNLDLELFNRVYPDFKPKYKTYPNVVSLEILNKENLNEPSTENILPDTSNGTKRNPTRKGKQNNTDNGSTVSRLPKTRKSKKSKRGETKQ